MSPRLTVVSATANPGKLVEMAEILGDAVALETRPEGLADVDETGTTLEANAELKARAVLEFTGRTAMADDTGLEVDASAASREFARRDSPVRTPSTPTTWRCCCSGSTGSRQNDERPGSGR